MLSIRGTSPPGRPSSPLILAAHLSFLYLDVHTATARVRLARDLRLRLGEASGSGSGGRRR
jgi:hypothetical protein